MVFAKEDLSEIGGGRSNRGSAPDLCHEERVEWAAAQRSGHALDVGGDGRLDEAEKGQTAGTFEREVVCHGQGADVRRAAARAEQVTQLAEAEQVISTEGLV